MRKKAHDVTRKKICIEFSEDAQRNFRHRTELSKSHWADIRHSLHLKLWQAYQTSRDRWVRLYIHKFLLSRIMPPCLPNCPKLFHIYTFLTHLNPLRTIFAIFIKIFKNLSQSREQLEFLAHLHRVTRLLVSTRVTVRHMLHTRA